MLTLQELSPVAAVNFLLFESGNSKRSKESTAEIAEAK
jgi:hypothetical protein